MNPKLTLILMIEKIKYLILTKFYHICFHENQKYETFIKNNTPMTETICLDCGKRLDYGHVYADLKKWECKTWIISKEYVEM